MNRARAPWLGVLTLNAAWMILLPHGRLLALGGVILSIVLAALWAGRDEGTQVEDATARAAALVVLPFLLPLLSFAAAPTLLGFWRIDGRTWLVLAWLAVAVQLARSSITPREHRVSRRTLGIGLFLAWSAVLWITVVADLGIKRVILEMPRDAVTGCQFDPLTTAFSIWESRPASEHGFLGWRSNEDFARRRAYAHHVHPFLFSMYAWVRGVRWLAGLGPYAASNTTPFLSLFVILAASGVLFARMGLLRRAERPIVLFFLFLGAGLIVTAWRFWNDLFHYTTDNPYPLLAGVFIALYAFLLEPLRPRLAIGTAAVFVALSPTYAPMLIAAAVPLFGQAHATLRETLRRNRSLVAMIAACLAVAVITYLLPTLIIRWKSYEREASAFLFRSGLDGDTTYMSNMFSAFAAPCPTGCCWGRPLRDVLFPAFVPLMLFVPAVWWRDRVFGRKLLHLLLFLLTPYLLSLILFPQAVSIHPYMYDHILLIPVIVTGAAAMVRFVDTEGLEGVGLLAATLAIGAVLMSNLLGLAQSLARLPLGH
jgi:hypothetical protein